MSTLEVSVYTGKHGSVMTDGYYIRITDPKTLRGAKMACKKARRKDKLSRIKGWFLEILERGELPYYTGRRGSIEILEENFTSDEHDLATTRGKIAGLRQSHEEQLAKVEEARASKAEELDALRKDLVSVSADLGDAQEACKELQERITDTKKLLSKERSARTRGHKKLQGLIS